MMTEMTSVRMFLDLGVQCTPKTQKNTGFLHLIIFKHLNTMFLTKYANVSRIHITLSSYIIDSRLQLPQIKQGMNHINKRIDEMKNS